MNRPPQKLGRKLILVADHDHTSRTVSKLILQQSGYNVLEAKNGRQCILAYSQYHPDLILLDFDLPDIDGLTCCQELRQVRKDHTTPIVILTALDDRESIERAFANGADDYILKPLHPCILQKRLTHLLEMRAATAQLRRSEERYRSVISNLQEIVFQTDRQGMITLINPAWTQITGFREAEVIGHSLYKFIHPVDRPYAQEQFERLLKGISSECRFEVRYLSHAQEVRWINCYACPIKKQDQSIDSISGTLEDITDIKAQAIQFKVERKINSILADSNTLGDALSQILKSICTSLGWEYGELWLPDPNDQQPTCIESWYYTSAERNKELVSLGHHFKSIASIYQPIFNIGAHLIEQIWADNELRWHTKIMPETSGSRTSFMAKAPARSMLSMPIFDHQDPLAMMLFFQRGYHPIDEHLLKRLGTIGHQIGNFMMRKIAEEKVNTQHRILQSELQQAAEYVRSLLPQPIHQPVSLSHEYIPSQQLGGDAFDYYWLDSENLVLYLLDVSGHGVRSALLSVSILNLLRHKSLQNADFLQPASVLNELNRKFEMNVEGEDYFTMWYGTYNSTTQTLTYASAGHPPALLVSEDASVTSLKTGGLAIGMFPGISYKQQTCQVLDNSFLYIFSDGIYEVLTHEGKHWSINEFTDLISTSHLQNRHDIQTIIHQVNDISVHQNFDDDCSLIQARL